MAEIGYESTTAYENLTHVEATTLNIKQIYNTIWLFACILPNALLIYIFVKNHLYRTNLYLILLNWTIANILSTFCLLYINILPEKYIVFKVWAVLYFIIHIVLRTLTVILVTTFMFKKFLDSKRSCAYFICAFWCVFALSIVIKIICSLMGYVFIEAYMVYATGPIKLFSVLVVIIKIGCHKILPPAENDKNFVLRMMMAIVYIFFEFMTWLLKFVTITGMLHWNVFFVYLMYVPYTDGYINLVLLILCNPTIKYHFYVLFKKRRDGKVLAHVADLDDPSSNTTA